ncbi:hypothetical protein CCR95_22110 [Thiocystis minor]|uniref:hypothetical protein n=1 Tax=Thiocystis minor TaxID=61597 RepID=UPI001911FB76|nr:hypothetical protein [Thiocystis minor]MBK5966696.1 hypothetical protein [Thiocystis minor]
MMSANTESARPGRPRRARVPPGIGLGLGLLVGAIAADATGTGLPPVGGQPPPQHASHLELILGSAVNSRALNAEDDSGLAWGFAEARISESWRSGFNGGAAVIGSAELWRDQPGFAPLAGAQSSGASAGPASPYQIGKWRPSDQKTLEA